jgi:glycosyltransferase involved in cell wall biosynthesis
VGPTPPTVGGISTFITSLIESDLRKEYDLQIFSTNRLLSRRLSFFTKGLSVNGEIDIFCQLANFFYTMQHLMFFPLRVLLQRPHLVHINTPSYWSFWENIAYVFFSKMVGIPVLLHIHGGEFDKFYSNGNSLQKNFIRLAMNLPEEVVALSTFWKLFFEEKIGVQTKVVVINNFVSAPKYSSKDVDEYERERRVEVLFFGGTDARRKGIFTLISAIPKVLQGFFNVHFTLVCKNDFESIKRIIKVSQIEKAVSVFSQISETEKIRLLHDSDIFVLPTFSEGLPIALLEAMAVGLPIISTPVGSIPEVVHEGENGYLIEPGNFEELAKKIIFLSSSVKIRKKMALNNKAKILAQYDQCLIIKLLADEYTQLVNKN